MTQIRNGNPMCLFFYTLIATWEFLHNRECRYRLLSFSQVSPRPQESSKKEIQAATILAEGALSYHIIVLNHYDLF